MQQTSFSLTELIEQLHFSSKAAQNGKCFVFKCNQGIQRHAQQCHDSKPEWKSSRPVTICRSKTTKNMNRNNHDHFDKDRMLSIAHLVAKQWTLINRWNIAASWSLCHASISTIMDIVFAKRESPNHQTVECFSSLWSILASIPWSRVKDCWRL